MRIKIKNKLNFFIFIKAKNMFKLKNIYQGYNLGYVSELL